MRRGIELAIVIPVLSLPNLCVTLIELRLSKLS